MTTLSGHSQNDTVTVQSDTTQYVLIPLKTLKEINLNEEACDTIKKRFEQTFRLYSLQKVQIKRFKRLDLNSTKIQNSSNVIEGVYQNSELILKKIDEPKSFLGRAWTFTKEKLIPALAIFATGYYIGKSG